jgi:serine phosphatase RsbU (regulator of sigma subunit)
LESAIDTLVTAGGEPAADEGATRLVEPADDEVVLLPREESSSPVGPPRSRRWRVGSAVLLLGLAVTALMAVPAEVGYRHNERRLLRLQTGLTASLLATAPRQTEATLGRIVGLAAESPDPVGTFKAAVASVMAPAGPFASASLAQVVGGKATVLTHVGTAPITDLSSPSILRVFEEAATSASLATSRATAPGVQKIGYLLSAQGGAGTFVVSASQQLPWPDRVTVAKGSPDTNLNFAIYFGRTTAASALVAATRSMPSGIVDRTTVPFGNSVLTLVASPRGAQGGRWAEYLPWGIAIVGIVISLLGAFEAERLNRRRAAAEASADAHRDLYHHQRAVSETLQRSLLPRTLPRFPGVDIAAKYVPATRDAEVGGDWYSVIASGDDDDGFVFVVGDVSGCGIQAAGTMASLRYTTRTLAKLGFPPAEILRRANDEINLMEDGHFATALVGSVSLATREMVIASAGHPPPYLLRDVEGAFIPLTTGPPLGITTVSPTPTTIAFTPGSTLIAFTDGLIERRNENLDVGFLRLAAVASSDAPSAEALLTRIVDTLTVDGTEDDVAILVIKFLAPQDSGSDEEAVTGSSAGR